MKKIIAIIALFCGLAASAQKTTPGNYTYVAQKYEWDAGVFKGLGLPSGSGLATFITGQVPRAGAVYYDSVGVDSGLYVFSGLAWRLVGVGEVTQAALDDTAAAIRADFPAASQTLQQVLDAGSTLTSTETVTVGANSLIVDGTNSDVTLNSGLGGVHVSSSGASASSFNSTHVGTGNFFSRINSNDGFPTAAFSNTTSSTNGTVRILSLSRFTTGTPGDGLGGEVAFSLETTGIGGAESILANKLISKFSTVDHPTRTSQFDIMGMDNGVEETFMNIQRDGVIRVNGNLDSLATKAYARSVGGSGGDVTLTGVQTLSNKRWTPRVGSTTSSGTPTINTDDYDIYKLTAQAADITSFTTNLTGTPVDGDIIEIQITGTATRSITWGASFVSSTVALPTTTDGVNTLTVVLQYFTTSSYGNNKWICVNSF